MSESDASDSDDARDDTLTSIARGMGARHHGDMFFLDADEEQEYDIDEFTSVPNTEVRHTSRRVNIKARYRTRTG